MFYGASRGIFKNARILRGTETEAEKLLWMHLKENKLNGFRFKRQHPIATFIADFYCHKAKLVIEIDGGYHHEGQQKKYDQHRDILMNELGLKVLRFRNEEIVNNPSIVLALISKHLSV